MAEPGGVTEVGKFSILPHFLLRLILNKIISLFSKIKTFLSAILYKNTGLIYQK